MGLSNQTKKHSRLMREKEKKNTFHALSVDYAFQLILITQRGCFDKANAVKAAVE